MLDNASYYGRIFARSGGLSDAVVEALKEQNNEDFKLNAIACDGIEACKAALLRASKNVLPNNFIEGMHRRLHRRRRLSDPRRKEQGRCR